MRRVAVYGGRRVLHNPASRSGRTREGDRNPWNTQSGEAGVPEQLRVFDRALLRHRQARARAQGPVTFLIDRVANELGERLGAVNREFDRALDLGSPSPAVVRALAGVPAI